MGTLRSTLLVTAVAGSAGCTSLLGVEEIPLADGGADARADAVIDAQVDAVVDAARVCDPAGRFGEARPVLGIPPGSWCTARLSADERRLYTSGAPSGERRNHLYMFSRSNPAGAFTESMRLGPSSPTDNDNFPTVSADERTIVFDSERLAFGGPPRKLFIATGPAPDKFGTAERLRDIEAQGGGIDSDPFLTADGAELWFASSREGSLGDIDLFVSKRTGNGFGPPKPVPGLNSSASDGTPVLSADRRTVYFQSTRRGNCPGDLCSDVWTARRSDVDDDFSEPTLVDELSTPDIDWPGWLSADGCRLYLVSNYKVYVAEREP